MPMGIPLGHLCAHRWFRAVLAASPGRQCPGCLPGCGSAVAGDSAEMSDPDQPQWTPGGGLRFRVLATSGRARRGRFVTAHGAVETPAFMPVGTQAAVKCATPDQVAATGAEVVLANTYHLSLADRTALVERHGGLHALMGWKRT